MPLCPSRLTPREQMIDEAVRREGRLLSFARRLRREFGDPVTDPAVYDWPERIAAIRAEYRRMTWRVAL